MSKRSTHGFRGLIADTAEMPAIKPGTPQPRRRQRSPRRSLRPVLIAVAAIAGSFLLGLAIRLVVDIPAIIGGVSGFFADLAPAVPGLQSPADRQVMKPGQDIALELGRKVEAPMEVAQVLPFRVQGGKPRFTVLGGYLLTAGGQPDKTRPVMAVYATANLDTEIAEGDRVLVSGLVVMADGSAQTATSILQPDQESDLLYITERVNFWDRVTMLGTDVGAYSQP